MILNSKRTMRHSFSLFVAACAALCAASPAARASTDPPAGEPRLLVLVDGDAMRNVATSAATVAEMLAEQGAALGPLDRCSVPPATPITHKMRVIVTRVEKREIVDRVVLRHGTREQFSPSLRPGTRQVKQAGRDGERVNTVVEYYKNGELTQRTRLSEKIAMPVDEVVLVGSRSAAANRAAPATRTALASRGYFSGRRVIEMNATGYGPGPECNGRWAGKTASGLAPGYGVVAVDPRFIPLGTRLYIDGYGYAVAGDVGSAIKGNRIDLGFDSYAEARRVGRKPVKVLILN